MIPESIDFTELSLEYSGVVSRKIHTTVPSHWTRYQFSKKYLEVTARDLDIWLEKNILGRWHVITYQYDEEQVFVVNFELATDAMMFRLKDAENTCFRSFY
jgi:hypothetical protein